MIFDTWLLCQQHAAALDAEALLLFLKRERISKERRAAYWRLWWSVEHAGADAEEKAQRVDVISRADQWRASYRDFVKEERRLAREEFEDLFRDEKQQARRRRMRDRYFDVRAVADADKRRLYGVRLS